MSLGCCTNSFPPLFKLPKVAKQIFQQQWRPIAACTPTARSVGSALEGTAARLPASKVVMAGRAPSAPGAAGGAKKPWRYYFVMAFPLSNSVPKDKLHGMLELTTTIERREEEYLTKMADREVLHRPEEPQSPIPKYIASVLKWTSVLFGVASITALAYVWQVQLSDWGANLDIRVIYVAFAITGSAVAVNAAIIVAMVTRHSLLLRAITVQLAMLVGACVFLLDEVDAVMFSQRLLAQALGQPRDRFTDNDIALVLNGGDSPSLWHRFFVDGPAWFLLWLNKHCVQRVQDAESSVEDDMVDSSTFFSPLWEKRPRRCARTALSSHLDFEAIMRWAFTLLIVALTAQFMLCLVLIWMERVGLDNGVGNTSAASRKRKRHRRRRGKFNQQDENQWSSLASFSSIVYACCAGLALTGVAITIVSVTLLNLCTFVGPTESWALALAAMFGIGQIVTAGCAVCLWWQHVLKSILVGGLALESYVMSALTEYCATLSPALGKSAPTPDGDRTDFLRAAYSTVFEQTCQPIKHWRLHVCVVDEKFARLNPRDTSPLSLFDSSTCQDEFAALLHATSQQALVLLMWMMAAQAVMLLWLLLPSLRSLAHSTLALVFGRCSDRSNADVVSRHGGDPTTKKLWKHDTVDLLEARRIYISTVRCQHASSIQAEASAFDAEWAKLTHTDSTQLSDDAVLFTHQFEAIVRVLILRRLTTNCKLDVSLSLSSDGKVLFATIFASDNLLMTALCERAATSKLQMAEGINPGFEFWKNEREVKNDNKVLDPPSVQQKFKLLMLNGVMSRKEAEIFPTESMARVSARVHALMRIHRLRSGSLRAHNPYPAFASYAPHTQFQYLYKKHPNRMDTAASAQQRRSAVLRTIDCLRLTRQLLEAEFDVDLMQRHGLIHAFVPLHSASRFDFVSAQTLRASWVAFWKPRFLPGEFEPQNNWLLNQLGRLSPFRQPINDVRDYFGESIAFYFAWLAFYNQFLVFPVIAVVVLLLTHVLDTKPLEDLARFIRSKNPTNASGESFSLPMSSTVFGLVVVLWGVVFAKLWDRRSVWYQLQWGMSELAEQVSNTNRANFRGEPRLNTATQEIEIHFPGHTRLRRQIVSLLVIVGACVLDVWISWVLLLAQGMLAEWIDVRLTVAASSLLLALLIQWNGDSISALSHRLSEWENYQSDRDFQRSVIFKVCVLQVCNSYSALLLTAFALYQVDGSTIPLPLLGTWVPYFQQRVTPKVSVTVQLELQLLLIFATRIVSHIVLMIRGLIRGASAGFADSTIDRRLPGVSAPSVEGELALQPFRGAYEDYTEIMVQFGLVAMFSSVLPIACVLAFIECALELRLDALDLCLFLQRPVPELADGIGPWTLCMRGVVKLGLVVNLALVYFASDDYSHWHTVRRLGAFLGSVLVLWIATECLWVLVPTESRAVQHMKARHAHLVQRHFGGEHSGGRSNHNAGAPAALSDVERKALELADVSKERDAAEESELVNTPMHLQERLALLRRLNVALRKQDDSGGTEQSATLNVRVKNEDEDEEIAMYRIDQSDEIKDHLVVGYFVKQESESMASAQSAPPLPTTKTTDRAARPPEAAQTEQYERTVLSGMSAIHVASERQRFDFAQESGWQQSGERRGSTSLLSRRFSLFRNRRKSNATPAGEAMTPSTPATTPSVHDIQRPGGPERPGSLGRRPSTTRHDSGRLPVVQLSGLEAVHEATRRNQFDFSADPWRESTSG